MYEHVIYMMNLPFEGWQYGRNYCMMEQELWFLPKLYNENFQSDGHCVTHKSWVQDAPKRVCLYANNDSTYILRTGSIYYMNMGKFSIWSQKGLISVLVIALVEAIWGLVGWHDQKIDVFSQVQECRSNK